MAAVAFALAMSWWCRCAALVAGPALRRHRRGSAAIGVANPRLAWDMAAAFPVVAPMRDRANVTLPRLTIEEETRLREFGSVERQRRTGRRGVALVVDTDLSSSEVWSNLQDVASWETFMRGVRSSVVRERRRGIIRAGFKVTKLRLPANIVLHLPAGGLDEGTIPFYLDTSCTNIAVDFLEGFWHVESCGDRTRVWLCAEVGACAVVPQPAIDYVASKALRRATAWLDPARIALDA